MLFHSTTMSGVQDKWPFHVFIGDVDLKRKEANKKLGDFYLLSLWTSSIMKQLLDGNEWSINIIHDIRTEEISVQGKK